MNEIVGIFLMTLGLTTMCKAGQDMKIIGHRGAKGLAPENTLSAFREALKYPIDAVELDVYRCKTGELVVIHDLYLGITTNGQGFVEEKTLAELKALDAGKGEKIPTLEEVFDLIDKRLVINIEIKGEAVAPILGDLITRYVIEKGWPYNNFLVSSFDHPQLKTLQILYPEIPRGVLYCCIPLDYAQEAALLDAEAVIMYVGLLRKEFIDDVHRKGMKAYVYTLNDPQFVPNLLSYGLDGIITDFPNLFI